MVDPGTVLTTAALLEKLLNHIKGIRERKPDKGVVEHVNELNALVFQMYESLAVAKNRISDLEKEVAAFRDWNKESVHYELKGLPKTGALGSQAFVYIKKPDHKMDEAPCWYCCTCFENSKKSPLQFRESRNVGLGHGVKDIWACHSCGAQYVVDQGMTPGTTC